MSASPIHAAARAALRAIVSALRASRPNVGASGAATDWYDGYASGYAYALQLAEAAAVAHSAQLADDSAAIAAIVARTDASLFDIH